jgi:hypothetical protein
MFGMVDDGLRRAVAALGRDIQIQGAGLPGSASGAGVYRVRDGDRDAVLKLDVGEDARRCRQAARNCSWGPVLGPGPLREPVDRVAQAGCLQRPGEVGDLGGDVASGGAGDHRCSCSSAASARV